MKLLFARPYRASASGFRHQYGCITAFINRSNHRCSVALTGGVTYLLSVCGTQRFVGMGIISAVLQLVSKLSERLTWLMIPLGNIESREDEDD